MINFSNSTFIYDEDVQHTIAGILQKYTKHIQQPIHAETLIAMVDRKYAALSIADEHARAQWKKVYKCITRTLIQLKQPYTIAAFQALVHATVRDKQVRPTDAHGTIHAAYRGLLDIPIHCIAHTVERHCLQAADYTRVANIVAEMYSFSHPDEHIEAIQTSIAEVLTKMFTVPIATDI